MSNHQPENEPNIEQASIPAINKNEKALPKRILTEQKKEFVELLSNMLIYITNKGDNEIYPIK